MCPQQIDSLIHSNLADIVVELLMTLYEGSGAEVDRGDLKRFIGYWDICPLVVVFFYFLLLFIHLNTQYGNKWTSKSVFNISQRARPGTKSTILQLICHQSYTGLPQQVPRCQPQVTGSHSVKNPGMMSHVSSPSQTFFVLIIVTVFRFLFYVQ